MIRFVLDTHNPEPGLIRKLYEFISEHPGDEKVECELVTSQGVKTLAVKAKIGRWPEIWDEARSLGVTAIPVDLTVMGRG